jgi:hypothetical protein
MGLIQTGSVAKGKGRVAFATKMPLAAMQRHKRQ